ELARAVERRGAGSPASAVWAGEAPLTPIQRWFFAQEFVDPDHWNMAVALDAKGPLDAGLAWRAARALVDHHDALRARFERNGTGQRQMIEPPGAPEAGVLLIAAGPGESREEAVARCAGRLN